MNEHGWMKTALDPAIDEQYAMSPEHPGVRVRRYDDGEQPGILEVLSPQLPPLPSTRTHTPSRARESSYSSSRSPKIFAAMSEQAEQERGRERMSLERNRSVNGNGNGGSSSGSHGYRNGYGHPDGNGDGSGSMYHRVPV